VRRDIPSVLGVTVKIRRKEEKKLLHKRAPKRSIPREMRIIFKSFEYSNSRNGKRVRMVLEGVRKFPIGGSSGDRRT